MLGRDICKYALIESAAVIPSKLTNALIPPVFGISYGIIKNRRFTGKVKVGRRILVIKSELDKFMKSQAENIHFNSNDK